MKNIIVMAVLVLAAYKLHSSGYFANAENGAFDESGKPTVRLFVGPGCEKPCDNLERTLSERGVSYELIDVSSPAGQEYGVRQYPVTMIGSQQVVGSSKMRLVGALAEIYGREVLRGAERRAMSGHFDENGNPLVVLYGTKWCGFCKKQREYFAANNIEFEDVDVEASRDGKFAYDVLQGAGYPLLYVGYRRFEGYREGEIKKAMIALSR